MKLFPFALLLFLFPVGANAQYLSTALGSAAPETFLPGTESGQLPVPLPKLRQWNHGMIIGLQRGRTTTLELGAEMHWRKIALRKPHIYGATANLEYNFGDHIVGYKAGVWRKQGRVNLTYGANVGYFTDFKGKHLYSIGPMVGFRLLGLHLVNGYNFLAGDRGTAKEPTQVNTLYMSLRYYFPIDNKFTWDKKDKHKKQRLKEKARRKKEKERKRRGEEEPKKIGERVKDLFRKQPS